MGGARSTNGSDEKYVQNENMEIGWEGVVWMHMDQEKGQWRALVSVVMNIQIP
jgi:hypothetical protein